MAPELYPHSFRENALALSALAHYRGSDWANEQGRRMLKTIRGLLQPDGWWRFEKLDYHKRLSAMAGRDVIYGAHYRERPLCLNDPTTATGGRFVDGLMQYYRLTGEPAAIELADQLARFHLAHSTHPDGRVNHELGPYHTHSYLGTLMGLLLFGLATNQKQYVDAVAATYHVSVRGGIVKESGFASHDFQQDCASEVASVSDAANIALWVAMNGYPEYFDDVERLVRSRLIPSQIVRTPPLRPVEDAAAEYRDGTQTGSASVESVLASDYTNLEAQMIGGFGCGIEHPNSASYVYTDVTSAVLHNLVDVYANIVTRTDEAVKVNLHFDYEDDAVWIASRRSDSAAVTIKAKTARNLLVRIPGWAPQKAIGLTVNGKAIEPRMIGHYAFVPRNLLPGDVVLSHALPERTTYETTMGHNFVYSWRGDEIVGVTPNIEQFPYYPSA